MKPDSCDWAKKLKANHDYEPKLKDKKFREKTSKIELERAENMRCQMIVLAGLSKLKGRV